MVKPWMLVGIEQQQSDIWATVVLNIVNLGKTLDARFKKIGIENLIVD